MIPQEQFDGLMSVIVEQHFPHSRLAYLEEKEMWIEAIYSGNSHQLISPSNGSNSAQHEFIAEATSILILVKLAIDTHSAIKNAYLGPSGKESKPLDESKLRAELLDRLKSYLPEEKASGIVEEVVRRTS